MRFPIKSVTMIVAAAAVTMLPVRADAADPRREGIQLEGMLGGAGCLPGRAPCRYARVAIDGYTRPSFAVGGTIGWRATRWLMLGGMYRLGMFDPDYVGLDADYSYAAQHTFAAVLRPILPVWRLDLGLNLAPGYSRQVFRHHRDSDREYSQGFAFLFGPTIDVFLTKRFFIGAEVDFIMNSQRRVCQRVDGFEVCEIDPAQQLTPTHQALFGLHLGGTLR